APHMRSTALSLTLGSVTGAAPLDGHVLSAIDVQRIAQAFELPRQNVVSDAVLVAEWLADEQALFEYLRVGHNWDATMAPVYVFWIRGDGGEPPSTRMTQAG